MSDERREVVQEKGRASSRGESRIYAAGEMAERVRRHAWERTSIGPMSRWPEMLLGAVNLMLESQFPTVLMWGPELVVLYNDAYQPLMAEKHPDALGQMAEECWGEAWHLMGPRLAAVMSHGESFYFENQSIPVMRQGELKDVYWTYSWSPVRNAAGAVWGVMAIAQDVTDKLAAERERDALAASLKHVLESTTDGLATLDKDWRYTFVNEQGARLVHLRPAEMVGQTVWELFPEAGSSEFVRNYRNAAERGEPQHFDAYYPAPLNMWMELHCYPSEKGYSVYFRDVTQQKKTQKALRLSESRFRKLFESDLMGIGIPDRFGGFHDCNDALLRLTGYTRADLDAGKVRWDTMTPPEYAELDAKHIAEALQRGSCTPYMKEYVRKDGTRVPILCGYALLEEKGDEFIGFALDLSAQKAVEAELRAREGLLRGLAESLPAIVWMNNVKNENFYCNGRYPEYLGVDASETMGLGWKQFIHPDDLGRTNATWKRSMETGQTYVDEFRLRRKDGMYRYFLSRAVPMKNEAGEVERWIGSATDVHDQKLAEQALRKSEKLATAGRLAASIAHEINNPLAGVTNALYLALLDESLSQVTRGYLKTAEQELLRVSHLTTQTLQFHKQSHLRAKVDLCEVVEFVLELYRGRLASKGIVVQAECERDAVATCIGDEIRQVLANLVGNAMDAMPDGGRLRVRVRRARGWTGRFVDGVKIAVADTGHGMPASVVEHIFEPFVTTKSSTGVGLGLWASDEIVRKHGGWIRVRSQSGKGTAFAIFLPENADADA